MESSDWLAAMTTTFSPRSDKAERTEGLDRLEGLKSYPDGWRPSVPYQRQLVVSMPKFAQVGLDMKDYVLARDLVEKVYDADGFTLRHARLRECPYSGVEVEFVQVEDKKDYRVHIDHVVAVADAWNAGGYRWSPKGRNWQRFCNDPANLLAVSVSANTSKGDRTADKWLPSNPIHDYRVRFVLLQVGVKARYRLAVTDPERAAMRAVLESE
jgi:hypothetical protein